MLFFFPLATMFSLPLSNELGLTMPLFLSRKIKAAFLSPQFQTDVVKPLKLDDFIDQEVKNLSGGELQRVAMSVNTIVNPSEKQIQAS